MTAGPQDAEEFDTAQALQRALRAEHAAVYAYAYIGARSRDEDRRLLCYEYLDAHRGRRDTLKEELRERDAVPAAGESSYALPDSDSGEALADYAVDVEDQTAEAYLELAAAPDSALRELALRSLQEATLRAMEWGADLPVFPGFPGGSPPAPDGG
ncbi:ferritin-like domain-containing protein [Streptomonospora sp. S1-112]|uniref:Ferritin-like domain-containing protein n=1 Tax=Streptomonospora mangrovi TaxID=2883123 RepID=A0A9X3SGH0_9ACTN|nr:ferritin-like domain-containing protein [Streptomonospora mangrovi]MDA0567838.1 ferritin-like domain-containing protein [Streptomonospora mangrovi]